MSRGPPFSLSCSTCNEPTPISLPSASIAPGAAPELMGGRGEDRLVEKIFPIAGEFLLADNHRAHRFCPGAGGDRHRIAELGLARAAELERRAIQVAERLDEAEAGLRIDGKRVSRGDPAFSVGEPDMLGLGDQIPDRQHKAALADDDAAAGALLAQRLSGEGVFRNWSLHRDDRFERTIQFGGGATIRQTGLRFVASPLLGHRPILFPSAPRRGLKHGLDNKVAGDRHMRDPRPSFDVDRTLARWPA